MLEGVWYITLDLSKHKHTVLDNIIGSSTIKHRIETITEMQNTAQV